MIGEGKGLSRTKSVRESPNLLSVLSSLGVLGSEVET